MWCVVVPQEKIKVPSGRVAEGEKEGWACLKNGVTTLSLFYKVMDYLQEKREKMTSPAYTPLTTTAKVRVSCQTLSAAVTEASLLALMWYSS